MAAVLNQQDPDPLYAGKITAADHLLFGDQAGEPIDHGKNVLKLLL